MVAELLEKTEKTTFRDGVEEKKTIQAELIFRDESGNEAGRLRVDSFNINFYKSDGTEIADVEAVIEGISEVLEMTL